MSDSRFTVLAEPPELEAAPEPKPSVEVPAELPPAPAPLPASLAVAGLSRRLEPGVVHLLGPLAVPGFRPRLVRIYVPSDFSPARPHPAVFLFDGQNLFGDEEAYAGGWHVDEVVEGLGAKAGPKPVVIGVDHGEAERISELSPFPLPARFFPDPEDDLESPGRLDSFLAWVTGDLLQALAGELPLPWQVSTTFVGGSSMGGLAAFYAHFHAPEIFGGALAMSPSFWLAERAIFREVAGRPNPPLSRIYLDAGGREDRGRLVPVARAMADRLQERGWGPDRLHWRSDLLGTHSEASWRRRLPRALRFLLKR